MTKIKDLKEKDHLKQNMMIKSCTKGTTSKGAPYLNLILQDNTGTIDGKFWDVKPADEAAAVPGRVAEVSFEVLEYNHALQLRVNRVTEVDQSAVDLTEFIMSSGVSRSEAERKINEVLVSLKNRKLRILAEGMLKKTGEKYYQYPAASRIHHSYLGGLAEHSLGMIRLAEAVCTMYPILDRDLIVCGALVHDMGKTVELGGMISSEYTDAGRLLGHISICQAWLAEVAEENGISDSEEAVLLRHMILSHHGKYEFGSPVLPEIPEAEVLSLIDNLDARMNTLTGIFENMKEGTWSQRIFSLENRQFYKAKGMK